MVRPIDVVDNRRLPPAHVWPPRRPVLFVRGTALTREKEELEAERILQREAEAKKAARHLDALFGPPDEEGEVVEVPKPEPARALPKPEEKEEEPKESMSAFYASLKRTQPVPAPGARPSVNAIAGPSRPRPGLPLRPAVAAPGSDWFIRKAEANFKKAASFSEAGSAIQAAPQVARSSAFEASQICSICHLPFGPLGARAHTGSIGHQLALDSSRPRIAPSVRAATAANAQRARDETEKLQLDRASVGWRGLEMMGWREGMGLGRREWELAADGVILAPGAGIGARKEEQREQKGATMENAIDLSVEEPSGQTLDEAIPLTDSEDEKEQEAEARQEPIERARRVPIIPVQHPGRRGIGAVSSAFAIKSGRGAKRSAPGGGQGQPPRKLSKSQRRKQHEHDRARWEARLESLR